MRGGEGERGRTREPGKCDYAQGDKCCNREYEVSLSPVASASLGHGFREEVRPVVKPYVIYTRLPLYPRANRARLPRLPLKPYTVVSRSPQSWYAL